MGNTYFSKLTQSFAGQKNSGSSLSVAVAADQEPIPVLVKDRDLLFATGTIATPANDIVPAPGAGNTIRVVALMIQNEAATANVVTVKFGATNKWRARLVADGDTLVLPIPAGTAWNVGDETPINFDISANTQCGYSVAYYVEALPA